MRVFILLIFLFFAAGASCASNAGNQQHGTLRHAEILERSAIPPYTGYLRTWIQFKVKAGGEEKLVVLENFESQKIPNVGESCRIDYHVESIEGHVGDKSVRNAISNIADLMECVRSDK